MVPPPWAQAIEAPAVMVVLFVDWERVCPKTDAVNTAASASALRGPFTIPPFRRDKTLKIERGAGRECSRAGPKVHRMTGPGGNRSNPRAIPPLFGLVVVLGLGRLRRDGDGGLDFVGGSGAHPPANRPEGDEHPDDARG